jgi:hypothetical protein
MSLNPSVEHVKGIKHILRYLVGMRKYCLAYDGILGYGLLAFANSGWDSDPFTKRSQSGYILKLANGLITWTSCAQKTIAQSLAEAEYMSLSDCSRQIAWVCNLMTEISYPMITATPIYGNNQGSNLIASNPITEHCTKHIDIKYHYICQEIETNHVAPLFVEGVNNTANLFTRNLLLVKFDKFIHELGLEFDKWNMSSALVLLNTLYQCLKQGGVLNRCMPFMLCCYCIWLIRKKLCSKLGRFIKYVGFERRGDSLVCCSELHVCLQIGAK